MNISHRHYGFTVVAVCAVMSTFTPSLAVSRDAAYLVDIRPESQKSPDQTMAQFTLSAANRYEAPFHVTKEQAYMAKEDVTTCNESARSAGVKQCMRKPPFAEIINDTWTVRSVTPASLVTGLTVNVSRVDVPGQAAAFRVTVDKRRLTQMNKFRSGVAVITLPQVNVTRGSAVILLGANDSGSAVVAGEKVDIRRVPVAD